MFPHLGTFTAFPSQARVLTGPQQPICSLCSLERETAWRKEVSSLLFL